MSGWRMSLGAIGVALIAGGLAACSIAPPTSGTSGAATAGSPRQTVDMPDVSSVAAAVQQQLRDQHDRLNQLIANPAASSDELAGAYGAMGQLFVAAEFFDTAVAAAAFQRALALSSDHVPSLVWLAELHLAAGRAGEAVPLLEKAQRLAPTDPAVAYGLGRAALESGDHARAVSLLEQTVAMAPNATRAHYPLALAYRALGDRARPRRTSACEARPISGPSLRLASWWTRRRRRPRWAGCSWTSRWPRPWSRSRQRPRRSRLSSSSRRYRTERLNSSRQLDFNFQAVRTVTTAENTEVRHQVGRGSHFVGSIARVPLFLRDLSIRC